MSEKPIHERVTVLEVQVNRIVADIESEKGTRARANADLNHLSFRTVLAQPEREMIPVEEIEKC